MFPSVLLLVEVHKIIKSSYTITVFFRINVRGVNLKSDFLGGPLIERGVCLQMRIIIDKAFFLDTRQAIEKTANLHYNFFIWLIFDHIHFFIDILFIRGRNEWIYGITFVN